MTATEEQLLAGLKAIVAIIDNNDPLEINEINGIWLIAAELVQAHEDKNKTRKSTPPSILLIGGAV